MKIKLNTPIERGDKSIDTLDLNLEGLRGTDLIEAERESRVMGDSSPNPLFASHGLACVAARAAGVVVDDINTLTAPDFLHVTTVVSNFLFRWALPAPIQAETSEKQS